MKPRHKEAFCLMTYADEVTGEREVIWNSRDGVTPFTISSRSGNLASHVDWHRDRCAPDHVPQLGDRVFVDLTLERAREIRRAYVEQWWDREFYGCKLSSSFASKDEAIEALAQEDYNGPAQPGDPTVMVDAMRGTQPDLIVVDETFLAQLQARRAADRRVLGFVRTSHLSVVCSAPTSGAQLIVAERQRQLDVEGWTPEHDDEHEEGDLAWAAVAYAAPVPVTRQGDIDREDVWPWERRWDKRPPRDCPPKQRIRALVKAGALIAAEIDRLQRAERRCAPSRAGGVLALIAAEIDRLQRGSR